MYFATIKRRIRPMKEAITNNEEVLLCRGIYSRKLSYMLIDINTTVCSIRKYENHASLVVTSRKVGWLLLKENNNATFSFKYTKLSLYIRVKRIKHKKKNINILSDLARLNGKISPVYRISEYGSPLPVTV